MMTDSMIGKQIRGYVLHDKLGQGGQGTVYAARHRFLARVDAIKLLKPQFCNSPRLVERFFDEARAAATIEHPGIVQIFDCGREHGRSFIIMERIEGETLHERLRRGVIPVDEAIWILWKLADALQAAHEHRDEQGALAPIVHRDLKPENIFLVPRLTDTVKIVDFGIAKLASSTSGAALASKPSSVSFGTVPYMAPEQCVRCIPMDHRVDLYALGCIFYEMLTGTLPFGREGVAKLMSEHRTLPVRALDGVRFDIDMPAAVKAIIVRLLAQAPGDRFASCRALKQAIEDEGYGGHERPIHVAEAGTMPINDIVAREIAGDMAARDISPVSASYVSASYISASAVSASDVSASDVSASDVSASDVAARDISASYPGLRDDFPEALTAPRRTMPLITLEMDSQQLEDGARMWTRPDPWLFTTPPWVVWTIAFCTGLLMLGSSILLGVGDSYVASFNWSASFSVSLPLALLFMIKSMQDADQVVSVLHERHVLTDTAVPRWLRAGVRATWRNGVDKVSWLAGGLVVMTSCFSVGEWFHRYSKREVPGEWWFDAPVMGVMGSLAQGIVVAAALAYFILSMTFVLLIAGVARRGRPVVDETDSFADDVQAGPEMFAGFVEAIMLVGVFLYITLYASNVKHIAIAAGQSVHTILFSSDNLLDVGPLHYNSTMAILACGGLIMFIAAIVVLIERAALRLQRGLQRSDTVPAAAPMALGPLPSVSRWFWIVIVVLAMFCFLFYRLGPAFLAVLAILLLLYANRRHRMS